MHKGIKPNAHDGCTQEVYSDSTKAPKHGYIEKKKKAIDSDEWQPYKFYGRSKGLNYSKSLSPYHFGLAM